MRWCARLVALAALTLLVSAPSSEPQAEAICNLPAAAAIAPEHGGGLNHCGCHFNRKTNTCHCHRASGCGCACEPASCARR